MTHLCSTTSHLAGCDTRANVPPANPRGSALHPADIPTASLVCPVPGLQPGRIPWPYQVRARLPGRDPRWHQTFRRALVLSKELSSPFSSPRAPDTGSPSVGLALRVWRRAIPHAEVLSRNPRRDQGQFGDRCMRQHRSPATAGVVRRARQPAALVHEPESTVSSLRGPERCKTGRAAREEGAGVSLARRKLTNVQRRRREGGLSSRPLPARWSSVLGHMGGERLRPPPAAALVSACTDCEQGGAGPGHTPSAPCQPCIQCHDSSRG